MWLSCIYWVLPYPSFRALRALEGRELRDSQMEELMGLVGGSAIVCVCVCRGACMEQGWYIPRGAEKCDFAWYPDITPLHMCSGITLFSQLIKT